MKTARQRLTGMEAIFLLQTLLKVVPKLRMLGYYPWNTSQIVLFWAVGEQPAGVIHDVVIDWVCQRKNPGQRMIISYNCSKNGAASVYWQAWANPKGKGEFNRLAAKLLEMVRERVDKAPILDRKEIELLSPRGLLEIVTEI